MIRRLFPAFLWFVFVAGASAQNRIVVAGKTGTASASEKPAKADGLARLRWNSLETLSGELLEASPTELSWKSPLFEEPLRLRWNAIRRIDQTLPATAAPEVFGIVLRDGSYLLGDLIGITGDTVTIKSARHGEVALKRLEVLRVRRLQGGKVVAAGPSGDVGWKTEQERATDDTPPSTLPRLIAGPGGALVMPYWNTKATLEVKTPDRVEFEIDLRFTEFPAFALRFDGSAANGMRVETWDDELVVVHGNEFKSVRKIEKTEREVALRIRWDRKAKKGGVFSTSGELLTELEFEGDFGEAANWLLHGKGRDLTLTRYRVREWDGSPPAKLDVTKPRMELADGGAIQGGVAEASGGRLKTSGEPDGAGAAMADVAEIIFSTDAPKPNAAAPTFAFADATRCQGQIVSIADGRGMLETTFTQAPLPVSMPGLRQVRWSVGEGKEEVDKANDAQDEILLDSTKLHGTLAASGDSRLRWMPVGGVTSVAPKATANLKVTRALPPNIPIVASPALFYTSLGDVIPATFRGIEGATMEIESDVVETRKLPSARLDAMQFGDVTQTDVRGFDAAGSRIVKGNDKSVSVSKGRLEMKPGGSYGHPNVMQAEEFRFSFDPQECSSFRLRLFTGSGSGERGTSFVVAPQGSIIYLSMESEENEFSGSNSAQVEPGKAAVLRVLIKDTKISIFVGERQIQQFAVDPKKRNGSGLLLEPAGAFGGTATTVALSDFSGTIAPGRTWLPEINPDMKAQALTVPRFRKERPPRHALIANNGDVLRGEIEGATATHFGFLAGLEKLRIPRARVNTAIVLKPPLKDGAPAVEIPSTRDLLDRVLTRNVRYGGASLSTLLSVITREVPNITFNNQMTDTTRRTVSMSFGGQSVREVLDLLCTTFEARYRVEMNGSITIENGPEVMPEIIEKGYWLKADAFADAESGRAWLTKKSGIEFPEGTSAQWNAAKGQLVVKQRIGTHSKIERLLEKEFGGTYAPLSHWVLLTNGGRLGFSVEKFDKDFILGRHPEYGNCRVPLALIYSIQTAKPAETEVMRAVAHWHLIPAREPVIAESGGDKSPSLGKEAAGFKIPLLTGGDFELKSERGKVVVLDFWATWCAPCIKSLPGLIEAVGAFPADRVKLIGVNQGESADAVKRFIETRQWKFTAGMDVDQKVAQQYGVTGIPHTVIVGPDGKIAWVKTGFSAEGPAEAAKAIKELLESPATGVVEPKAD